MIVEAPGVENVSQPRCFGGLHRTPARLPQLSLCLVGPSLGGLNLFGQLAGKAFAMQILGQKKSQVQTPDRLRDQL